MDRTTAARSGEQGTPRARREQQQGAQPPTWRNTRPRGNPEIDHPELARNRARMEAVLGR
jgi:hypothetical protein